MVSLQGNTATFRFLRPHARRVHLVGEFNGWQTGQLPMARAADGHWVASLSLKPGTYRFRYLADGQWFVDYAAFGVDHGPYGLESVVQIPESFRPRRGRRCAARPAGSRECACLV